MRVAGIQTRLHWEDPERNFQHLRPRIAEAAARGARLVALPEMFPSGFSMAVERIAEKPGGPGESFLREQAARHQVAVLGSVATRDPEGGKPRNLGLAALPDGSLHRYTKIHPFRFGGEDLHYQAGEGPLTFCYEGVRISLAICYDLRFAELFAPLAAGTDLFVVLANWPEPRREHWTALLRARSIECLAYVLGVNRVGEGGGLVYTGDSVLHGPGGVLLGTARPGVEEILYGEVDLAHVEATRRRFQFLEDRRPDVYRRL